MVRIQELGNGVVCVTYKGMATNTVYTDDPTTLDRGVYEKYMMLRATDVGTYLDGIGSHITAKTFWVLEAGDVLPTHAMLTKMEIRFKHF